MSGLPLYTDNSRISMNLWLNWKGCSMPRKEKARSGSRCGLINLSPSIHKFDNVFIQPSAELSRSPRDLVLPAASSAETSEQFRKLDL